MPTISAFLSPVEPAFPLSWQCGEPRTDTGAKDSHVAHQRLPCVEGHSHSKWYGTLVVQRSHLIPLCRKAREGEESPDDPVRNSVRRWGVTGCPCGEKRVKARSHLTLLCGKSGRRQGVTWRPCVEKRAKARSHLMPQCESYQPSRFCCIFTPVVYAPTKWCSTRSYSIVSL